MGSLRLSDNGNEGEPARIEQLKDGASEAKEGETTLHGSMGLNFALQRSFVFQRGLGRRLDRSSARIASNSAVCRTGIHVLIKGRTPLVCHVLINRNGPVWAHGL